MKPPTTGSRDRLSMSCDIESRRPEPERQMAWHQTCVRPERCTCPWHRRERGSTGDR